MGKSNISMAIFNSYVKLPDLTQVAATGSYQSSYQFSAGFTSEVCFEAICRMTNAAFQKVLRCNGGPHGALVM